MPADRRPPAPALSRTGQLIGLAPLIGIAHVCLRRRQAGVVSGKRAVEVTRTYSPRGRARVDTPRADDPIGRHTELGDILNGPAFSSDSNDAWASTVDRYV